MDKKDKIIQTLASVIAHNEIVKAELLAVIQELQEKLKEGEKDGDNSTGLSEG